MTNGMKHHINKTLLATGLLAVLGYCGNLLALPMAFGVSFIFGSVFTIIALGRLGLAGGTVVALAASCHTFFLWNHPYAIFIFTAEAIWIGLALRRGRSNLLLTDCCYWLVLGMPLVVFFYTGVMHLGLQSTIIIVLKQSLNGIFNALVASILLNHTPIGRWPSSARPRPTPYSSGIFHLVAISLMVPSLSMLFFANYHEIVSTQERITNTLLLEAQKGEASVARWIERQTNAVRSIAKLGTQRPLVPSAQLQEELRRIKFLFPDFHNVFLGDAEATTLAFFPAQNEQGESTIGLNFADRDYFKQLQSTLKPVISDVFMGRGGVFAPIFTISVPHVKDGILKHFGLGAINLDRMQDLFRMDENRTDLFFTVLDQRNNVVVSTSPERAPLDPYQEKNMSHQPVTAEVFLRVPGAPTNISIMQAWQGASYYNRRNIPGTPWTLLVEYPVAQLQEHFYHLASWSLGVVGSLFGVMIVFASFISRRLTHPLQELSRISRNLPERIDRNESVDWPQPASQELADLMGNFRQMAADLHSRILQIRETNHQLEQRVEERTTELQEQQQRLAQIIFGTNVGTWEWIVPTGETFFNERWAEIIGYRLEELAPVSIQTWLDHAHPEDLKHSETLIKRHLSGELENYVCECRMRHKDGHWVWILDCGRVVSRTEDGRPLRMSGTHQDISDRKEHEEELHQARLRADSANRSKSEFLANMSHEIRTPMNGVLGMAQLLEMTELTVEQQDYVKTLKVSSNNLLLLLNDILDLSKIEAGKLGLELTEFRLRDCINEAAKSQTAAIIKKGLVLEIVIDENIPRLLSGDPLRIKQILLNLLSNAVKFTGQGTISLSARVVERHNQAVLVAIAIRDTGIGIAAAALESIFQPFVQADCSTSRHFGGTGLGLSICQRLLELMHGSIAVESTPGVGSCFTISLPLTIPASSSIQSAPVAAPLRVAGEKSALQILFVEDNPINCDFGTALLKKLGHQAMVAHNGMECLATLETTTFDLVLMDVQMPTMDGFEATRIIRDPGSRVRNHQVPIIAMTAYAMEGDRERCLGVGMNDYMAKPLTLPCLIDILTRWSPQSPSSTKQNPPKKRYLGKPSAPDRSKPAVAFNREDMLERLMHDQELACAFTRDFLENVPRHLTRLWNHLDARDLQSVVYEAHGIKGAAAMLGAELLRDAAHQMEQAASVGEFNATHQFMLEVEQRFDQLKQVIQNLQAAPTPLTDVTSNEE